MIILLTFHRSHFILYTDIYRKNAGAQSEHPDDAPAFTATLRTPQCGHTFWVKKLLKHPMGLLALL
jgi:hypothetical protein